MNNNWMNDGLDHIKTFTFINETVDVTTSSCRRYPYRFTGIKTKLNMVVCTFCWRCFCSSSRTSCCRWLSCACRSSVSIPAVCSMHTYNNNNNRCTYNAHIVEPWTRELKSPHILEECAWAHRQQYLKIKHNIDQYLGLGLLGLNQRQQ